jgi:uncharacterized protein YdeI (YjbR/CyaY-like superfamily)
MSAAPPASSRSDYPIVLCKSAGDWERWLRHHHESAPGVWLRLGKKNSELGSVSYAEAVELALCYGWIDGQQLAQDRTSWLQKFTPRGRRSVWSTINRERAKALIRSGRMQPCGLAAIALARQDGRWSGAYDSPSRAVVPADFQAALDRHPNAKAFFATVSRANRYALLYRIQTAKKAETRARRIEQFIAMLERGKTIHP